MTAVGHLPAMPINGWEGRIGVEPCRSISVPRVAGKLPGPVTRIAAPSCYLTSGEVRQQPVVLAVAGRRPSGAELAQKPAVSFAAW